MSNFENSAALQSAGLVRGTSPILVSAALSVAGLIIVTGMYLGNLRTSPAHVVQNLDPAHAPVYVPIEDADGNGRPDWEDELARSGIVFADATSSEASATDASSSDALSMIASNVAESLYGGYLSLKQYNQYTPQRGEQLAQSVVQSLHAPLTFTPYTVNDLTIDNDTSETRVLTYRADMRVALAPMVTDDLPEIEYFAQYISTKDSTWLTNLQAAADRYHEAEKNMLAVKVPKDAVPEHLRALNALGAYANIIGQISHPGDNALAYAALLKTMNDNEQEMLNAFNTLAEYYVRTVATK